MQKLKKQWPMGRLGYRTREELDANGLYYRCLWHKLELSSSFPSPPLPRIRVSAANATHHGGQEQERPNMQARNTPQ
jgi:hypothetical protein